MTCGTCNRGKAKPSGFIVCEFRKGWEWFAPTHPCMFTPARYQAKKV